MSEMYPERPLSPEQQATLNAALPAPLLRIALTGVLVANRLREALQCLVERHASLRMALRPSPLYRGLRQQPVAAEFDWQSLDWRDSLATVEPRLAELRRQPFALDSGCLLRAVLCRLGEQDWQLALILAPTAGDRLSLQTLLDELQLCYAEPAAEFDEVCQYAQFIDWRAELDADAEAESGRAYWADLGLEKLPPLHLAYRQPAQFERRHGCLLQAIPAVLLAELQQLAASRQQPLSTLLQAAWWVLLARISAASAFVGGWQHDCRRDYDSLAGSVGVFDKVLPLPVRIDLSESFAQWLQRLAVLLEEHVGRQEYWPLAEPPQQAHLSVGFLLSNPSGERQSAGLNWRVLELPGADPRFELALQLEINTADCSATLQLHHAVEHYGQDAAQCLLNQYLCLLENLPTHIDSPLAEPNLSPAAERTRQLVLCGEARDFGQTSLPARLAYWAAATPAAEALHAQGLHLNYAELNARVDVLAAALQGRGIGPESRVALLLPRSGELLLALLAVLRAGGAYLPLDPSWPAARVRKILADAQAQLLLIQSDSPVAGLEGQSCLTLAALQAEAAGRAPTPVTDIRLDQAAYLLYTSGSSGEPKGVLIEHGQLLNYSAAVSEALALDSCKRFALTSSVAADLGNTALFGALWNGACLVVANDQDSTDAAAFARFVREQQIDCLKIVPSHLAALLEDDSLVLPSTLVLGGEATPRALIERIGRRSSNCRIHNHYGPTETTVGLLVHSFGQNPWHGDSLPLDRTLANGYAYVLEAAAEGLRLAPLGAAGELYLGGAQLCRGYLNGAAEAFVDDPLRPGERLYRSGDRARLLPGGSLQLLGRVDQQLKIRGFRVEPGELEAALLALDEVNQAVVQVVGEQLLAYVVSERQPQSLLAELRRQLPDYLQPTQLLNLPVLPRLANGKIDRQALPEPAGNPQEPHDALQAPRDALEALLAELYAELLERDTVGIDHSLFDLGGHSLLVIKLCARLRKLLQLQVAPGLVFDYPSVAALAQALRERESTPGRLLQLAELRRTLAAMPPEERAALQARALTTDNAL